MQTSKILLKDGQTVDLVDSRIDDGYIETWNNKPNVEITSPNGTINVQSSTDVQTNTKTFDISVNTDNVATNKDVSDLEDKINYKLDSKEDVSNKIQVVNDSSTTEYPSSKAVANFVNSSVSTNTATFLGNFSLEDLGLTYQATEVQIASALNSHTWPTGYPTNNDYVYVEISNPQSSIYDKVQRYKYRGSVASWGYEYTLNNSSFTSEEMAAIDSGITSQDVTNLRVDHTTLESHVHDTSNPHSVTKAQVGLSKVDNTSDADKPVSTAQQNALNMKLDKTGNAATATKAANADITRTADTTNGDKLQIGTGTAVNITNAKHAASADSANTATNYASDGGIANALNGKSSTGHLHDDRYIRASSGNKSLSFGGTTTIGTVQGNNVNLVMPEADSDIYYVSANVTSFSDVLAAFNSKQKLILQIGFEVSDTATAAYNIPLNRIIFSDNIPSTFTWVYTQDRLQGDANRGAITTWSLGSSGWESHSEFTYYADTAGLSNKASALIDFGNTKKMTRVGWAGNSIGKVIATGSSKSLSESSYLAAYYVADDMGHVKDVKAANVQVGSAKSVNADAGESISSTGTNGSMEILNGALSSSSGGGGSCSIDGDGISFTKGVGGSSMTADSISTAGTGTFTGGVEAKGRSIDGSATILTNKSSIVWNASNTHLVVNRSAESTTTIDLKNLLNGVVYWIHVPRDNIIALMNSSSLSTFYCYDSSFTMNKTTDTYNIRAHIRGNIHGGFSSAIVRSNNNFYVMMDY